MKTIEARSLLAIEPKDVFKYLPEVFKLAFDDGEIILSTREQTFYSRYIWMVHDKYPGTPLLRRHFVTSATGDKPMDSNTHTKLISTAIRDTITTYDLKDPQSRETLQELAFKIPNLIMNEVMIVSLSHVTTIDITDFTNLADYQPMADVRATLKADDPFIDDTIRSAYDSCLNIVMTDKNLDTNNLVTAVRCGMVSANQFVQCSVARGVPSYKNGVVMGEPILTNFTEGMYRLYDILAEGQSAAKAMDMQEDPLKETEYFARRLQLLTMTIRRLHRGDCGSRNYTPWRVEGPKKDSNGKVIYKGDVANLLGKYYLDEEKSTPEKHVYKVITEADKHLEGQLIHMRVAYRCNHADKYGVCDTCFGNLSYNVSRFANLGHICAATMTQQSSQSVLSTKHLDASSLAALILLGSTTAKYFTTNSKKNAVFFRPELKGRVTSFVVSQAEAVGLVDIKVLPWDKINPSRVSEIENIELSITTKKDEVTTLTVDVKQSDKKGMFTLEFLKHLKEKGWTTDSRNMFVIDVTDWDFSKPVFKFPDVEYSYSDHSKQIADLIEYLKLKGDKKKSILSPDILHQELFKLVNSKLNVSSSCLEVIIYSLMVDGHGTYGIGRNVPEEILGLADEIIKNRTLSTAYGYENVANTLKNPASFFNNNRPNSPFDVLISPYEVVKEIELGLR